MDKQTRFNNWVNTNNKIYFEIRGNESVLKQFINLVKNYGCRWLNGEEIEENNNLSLHMAVSSEKYIANIAGFAWCNIDNILRIDFNKFLSEDDCIIPNNKLGSYEIIG
jgi:hypothetical protein